MSDRIDALARVMARKGLTQGAVARAAGVSRPYMSLIMAGKAEPRDGTLRRIEEAARSEHQETAAKYARAIEMREHGMSYLAISLALGLDKQRVRRWCTGAATPWSLKRRARDGA